MAVQEALPVRLGHYRLLHQIGKGGMGVVHLAADPRDRLVAVKLLPPHLAADAEARHLLARETAAMQRVHSPFAATVIDADLPYLVTQFIPGHCLDQVIASDGPLNGRGLQRLAYGLAEALAAVHAAGFVHQDVKPSNVMMMSGNDPVLIDFGIAHVPGTAPLTRAGGRLGTPGYLAPEVIDGQPCGPPADVHAWEVTVAFAARGEPVYGAGSYNSTLRGIERSEADLTGVPDALLALVGAALVRCPEQRPSAAWLARHTAGLSPASPAQRPVTVARPRRARAPRWPRWLQGPRWPRHPRRARRRSSC